jgi:hypothetical protein
MSDATSAILSDIFAFVLRLSGQMPGEHLKFGNDRFRSYSFKFIMHYRPIFRRCILWDTENVANPGIPTLTPTW